MEQQDVNKEDVVIISDLPDDLYGNESHQVVAAGVEEDDETNDFESTSLVLPDTSSHIATNIIQPIREDPLHYLSSFLRHVANLQK
jgi:hypothetical protein